MNNHTTLIANDWLQETPSHARSYSPASTLRLIAATSLTAVLLAGCSSIPRGYSAAPVTVEDIVHAVHCEMASIPEANPDAARLLDAWKVGTDYNLIVTETTSATPGLTLKPALAAGKLSLPGSATFNDVAKHDVKFRDFFMMADVASEADCPVVSPHGKDLGLAKAILEILQAFNRRPVGDLQLDKTSVAITFTVTRTLDGGLTFEAATFSASLQSSKATRTLDNRITVAFEQAAAKGGAKASTGRSAGASSSEKLNDRLDLLTNRTFTLMDNAGNQVTLSAE